MADNFFKTRNGLKLGVLSSAPSNPVNGDMYYDTTLNKFQKYENGAWSSFGGSGGSGSKNYLAAYTASLASGVANTGNGDFESGGTSGWSLAHSALTSGAPSSTASAGTAFSSSNGGTAATKLALSAQTTFSFTKSGVQFLGTSSNVMSYNGNPITDGIKVGMAISTTYGTVPTTAFVIGVTSTTVYMSETYSTPSALSFNATFTMAQSAGLYSGILASNATDSTTPNSTAGDMLISDAFFIDAEDQAKMLSISFSYKNLSGRTAALNFSGTSSNSLSIWIYDVTNAAWIQPQGVYNLVQVSGIGKAVATFQTPINSTKLQLAIVNVNASSGCYALAIDDFVVGPQTVQMGPAMTDWTSYTPSVTGSTSNPSLGSGPTQVGWWRRVGSDMEIIMHIASGASPSAGSGAYRFSIPSFATIDTAKFASQGSASVSIGNALQSTILGRAMIGAGGAYSNEFDVLWDGSGTSYVNLLAPGQSANTVVNLDRSYLWGAGGSAGFDFGTASMSVFITCKIPISGWSSNTVMSNDTDTRVVALEVSTSSQSLSNGVSATPIFTNVIKDTHGGYNASNGIYTVPVSGFYFCSINVSFTDSASSAVRNAGIAKNGTIFVQDENDIGTGSASTKTLKISGVVFCNAGDTINGNVTQTTGGAVSLTGNGNTNTMSIFRLSGPAIVAASETVNATYRSSNQPSITTSTPVIVMNTKDYDSHNAYSTSTGLYTVPVSGKYRVSFGFITNAVTLTTAQFTEACIQKNGSTTMRQRFMGNGASANYAAQVSGTIQCNAGDTIAAAAFSSVNTSATNDSSFTFLSIDRVGN